MADKSYKETVLRFENNEANYDYILKQRYYTVLKLIEINNVDDYDKIIDLNEKLDSAKVKLVFHRVVSLLCISGALFVGYSISNYSNDVETMLPALLSSTGIVLTGLLSRIEYFKNKRFYYDKVPVLTDCIEDYSKKFTRIKR